MTNVFSWWYRFFSILSFIGPRYIPFSIYALYLLNQLWLISRTTCYSKMKIKLSFNFRSVLLEREHQRRWHGKLDNPWWGSGRSNLGSSRIRLTSTGSYIATIFIMVSFKLVASILYLVNLFFEWTQHDLISGCRQSPGRSCWTWQRWVVNPYFYP